MPVEVTDAIRPRRGEHPPRVGPRRARAPSCGSRREHAGVNSNVLTDEELFDPVSGNAVLNGIPVSVAAALSLQGAARRPQSGAMSSGQALAAAAHGLMASRSLRRSVRAAPAPRGEHRADDLADVDEVRGTAA